MLVTSILASLVFTAQPEPSALDAARRFAAVYDHAPLAERADFTITETSGARTEFAVELHRGAVDGLTHTLLELPGLRLHHAGRELTAERSQDANPAVVFQISDTPEHFPEAIAPHVPAMPMPQLWRFDAEGRCIDPALGSVELVAFDPDQRILHARTRSGPLTFTLDSSDRLRSLDAPLDDGRILARFTSIEPSDPATWQIETQGRWVVTRLAQLTPPRSPIVPGIQLDDLNLMTPAFQGIKLSAFQGDDRVRQSGPWIVLLVCRSDAEESVLTLAGEVASSLWNKAAREIAGLGPEDVARYWLGHRALVVSVSGELEILPAQMAELAERSPQGVPLLVSTEPSRTIDRLAAPAPLTAILIDPARTVGAVVPIENAETGVSAIREAMHSFVRRRDEAPSPEPAPGG